MKWKVNVMPVQSGIQYWSAIADWTPDFAGVTGLCWPNVRASS